MAIQTVAMRNALVDAYKGQATYAALYSTAPGASAGTELTGGSYARKAVSWGATANSASTATAIVFDVPFGRDGGGVRFPHGGDRRDVSGWGVADFAVVRVRRDVHANPDRNDRVGLGV